MKMTKIKTMKESLDNSDGITLKGNDGAGGGQQSGSSSSAAGRMRDNGLGSIDPNAPISPRIAARTTTDLGAPRVSRGFGRRR